MRIRQDPPEGQTPPGGGPFVWLAGRPSLDLCNTRLGAIDLLPAVTDLASWLGQSGIADRPTPVEAADLVAVRALRDALRDALLQADCRRVGGLAQDWLGEAPGRLEVDSFTLRTQFCAGDATVRCLMVAVVLDAVEIARDRPDRVRECVAPQCPVVYLDLSRNRSRRWCSMERCGARVKAAAYYRRHAPYRPG